MIEIDEPKAGELLALGGVSGPVSVQVVKRGNDVFRFDTSGDAFYLKTYTKPWYGDAEATAFCVEHEVSAWETLERHGLGVPDVVVAERGLDNPLERPFIITRRLEGDPFTARLLQAGGEEFGRLLETVGDYLRRMHAITFEYPGYIAYGGPLAPPEEGGWQHPIWTAAGTQREALANLDGDRQRLSPELVGQLEELFATMAVALAPASNPPRFTHGDCHAHQFFLAPDGDGWRVTGVLDMEVASAGDPINDLVKLGIEMAAEFAPATRWWEPLFAGYGGAPDFEQYKMRLMGRNEVEFKWVGADKWSADRETMLRGFLAARNWAELFTA